MLVNIDDAKHFIKMGFSSKSCVNREDWNVITCNDPNNIVLEWWHPEWAERQEVKSQYVDNKQKPGYHPKYLEKAAQKNNWSDEMEWEGGRYTQNGLFVELEILN